MTLRSRFLFSTVIFTVLSGTAMAADLPQAQPQMAMPAAVPAALPSWDGPYIGASVGYAWGKATDDYSGISSGTTSANLSGWLFGGQLGYNFVLSNNIIAGIEGNVDWLNEDGAYGKLVSQKVNWEGSVRGRLGVDMGQFLPYAEAGIAFANSKLEPAANPDTNTHTGWTVGAGVEFMLADQLSGNLEYRYADYGTQTYNVETGYDDDVRLKDSTVRFGLNYHF